jgi:nicotinamide riboside kinase
MANRPWAMVYRLWTIITISMIKKIVAIGPESTGKSTLCEQLARHYKTTWCPEYAREYLNQNGVKYGYEDLIKITQGQLVIEDYCLEKVCDESSIVNGESAICNLQSAVVNCQSSVQNQESEPKTQNSKLLFLDTNMYVMKVWYEYVFRKCEQLVLDEIAKRKYDLYLLCNIDLPWAADEMREYPNEQPRIELYNIYKDLLINQTTPWVEISGNYEERLQKAIEAVGKYCNASSASI